MLYVIFKGGVNINIGFITNAYTSDGLELPIVHFESKEKAINCNNFEYKIIDNIGHTYKNKELEFRNLIFEWINKNF